jgi:hypothetical protein
MKIRSGLQGALTAALAATIGFTSSTAEANGRFPRGEHVIEFPSDPNKLVLAATYGLLTTQDGGKDWRYICEAGFSFYAADAGFNGDPLVALTAKEAMLASVQTRVTKSSDFGCEWTKSFDQPDVAVDDIATAPSNRDVGVAIVRNNLIYQVQGTTDGGATWKAIGTPLTMLKIAYTIDLDPKDPNHIMVTGITDFDPTKETGVFLDSANNGMTWTMTPIPKTNIDAPPYIAAVHPTDPKKIFVRTDEWPSDGAGANYANDALLYSKDGGRTWSELVRPNGTEGGAKLFGFALSPDGNTVLAGFGDPVDGGGRNVDRTVMGIYKSTGADYAFDPMPKPLFLESVTCITWTAKGIYVCGSPDGAASYIGLTNDLSTVSPATIPRIMRISDLKGEPTCCNGRSVNACDWASECTRFDACPDGGVSTMPDAGMCVMPDAGGQGGAAGSAGAGGSGGGASGAAGRAGAGTDGGATGGAGGAGTGGATTDGSGGSRESCSCRLAPSSNARSAAGAGLLFGLAVATGYRRSRRRRAH